MRITTVQARTLRARGGAGGSSPFGLFLLALLISVLFGGSSLTAGPLPAKSDEPEEGFIVKFHRGVSREAALQQMQRAGGTFDRAIPKIDALVGSTPRGNLPALLEALKRNPQVQYAEPDYEYEGLLVPNDPLYPQQYAPGIMEADSAWNITQGDSAVVVAVLDSGVDFNHPDLQYANLTPGYDFVNSDTDPTDDLGHGTEVTGIIAATLNNAVGIAGLAPDTEILVVKIITSGNSVRVGRLGEAIIYAADQGAHIINLSLGGLMYSSTVEEAVAYAWNDAGALLVAAAGNTNSNPFYPAAFPQTMAVSATTAADIFWNGSNYGEAIDIAAPGEDIRTTSWSPTNGSGYGFVSGTSFSTAQVSGVAALVLARNPNLTNAQLRDVLQNSADDLGNEGWDIGYGHGRVNAYNAVLMAGGSINNRPTVTITAPSSGTRVGWGQSLSFAGTATDPDPEDQSVNGQLTWSSNLEGTIGSGTAFTRTLNTQGTHLITATSATDHGGLFASASIRVTVSPPTSTFATNGTLDGWVLESGENTNVGGSMKATDATSIGLMLGDDRNNKQYKSILSFDTSGLPDNAVITSATLRMMRGTVSGTSPFDTHGALLADIHSGGFNGNVALEVADFQAPATATQVASLGNASANNTWSEGALNAAGLAAINKVGVSQFRVYFNLDDNNDAGADYLGYYPGEYATSASRPQLVVGYYVNDPPTVTIIAPAEGQSVAVGSTIEFAGSASDLESGNRTSTLVWTSNLSGQIGTGDSFYAALPQGTHIITATATDNEGASGSATRTLRVRNSLPEIAITSPATEGTSVVAGTILSLAGWADDLEDGNLTSAIIWISDRDGHIGSGGSASKVLTVGTHTLTASVTDSQNHTATDSVSVTVSPATATTTLSSNGAEDGWVLESGETTNLGGSFKAADSTSIGLLVGDTKSDTQYKSILSFNTSSIPANAAIQSAQLRLMRGTVSGTSPFDTHGTLWVDVRSGGFSGNVALEKTDFEAAATAGKVAMMSTAAANNSWSQGNLDAAGLAAINRGGVTQFRLYFNLDDNDDVAIDYLGFYAGEYATTANRPQLVVTYQVNNPPTVNISTLPSGTSFPVGIPISFIGDAFDVEDGNRTSTLQWTSSLDGSIGTGGSFSKVLSLGTHTITATATDSQGATGSAILTVRVRNSLPEVTIASPAEGAVFTHIQTINFSGTADDLEDQNLTGSIIWTSSRDGQIGTGGSFSRTLSVGTHLITASVTDSQQNTRSDTATITVNQATAYTTTLNSVGTYDGWVLESGETTGVGGTIKSNDTSSKGLLLGDDASDKQYKSILSFDTAGIPDNAVITSATLRMMRGTVSGTSPFDTHGALWADIVTGAFNGNVALEVADFQAPATAQKVASLSNATANNSWSEGALNSAGLAAINKVGVTQLRVYFDLDDNDDLGLDYLGYYAGDYSTASSRPQLMVTYWQ